MVLDEKGTDKAEIPVCLICRHDRVRGGISHISFHGHLHQIQTQAILESAFMCKSHDMHILYLFCLTPAANLIPQGITKFHEENVSLHSIPLVVHPGPGL